MITEHVETFAGLPVAPYDPAQGIQNPEAAAHSISLSYDDFFDRDRRMLDVLRTFVDDPVAHRVTAIVIGAWDFESSIDSSEIVAFLASHAARLPSLRALFLGDIVGEEQEISWIRQSNVSPLLDAFPLLRHFRVRGGDNLDLTPVAHPSLTSLVIESGGLPGRVVRGVLGSSLPNLRHLELWLGEENYGRDIDLDDLAPLLQGDLFPALEVLALRDAENADELATSLATAPVLGRIRALDLSLGDLGDAGVEALLASPYLRSLGLLDIHHHFVSDAMLERLRATGVRVDASEQESEDQYDGEAYRYIAHAE